MARNSVPVLEEARPPEDAGNNRGNFTRNLAKEDDSAIARKMFFGGLAFLPWLWAVNAFFYRRQLLDATLDPTTTLWVRRSAVGFVVVTCVFVAWMVTFQLTWKQNNWQNLLLVVPAEDLDKGW
ncbi:hypothetical protein SDRG_10228 [Saprolegnia diclina VS20]|uniref:Gamma-secretase subunit PEN-2 n=1 Tax=Saprolegnia diclina (strain VS20) TaxID=1156394 RepID=T0Q2H9_SAPDV|nr:hypothetical protein SDRG_10228 [Saprolegnia diclina VS20]EQC32029.1 hypothetical protein SDRG_10228 [Saprolegnia diclina VS20]|eukprot:XP_008614431.1 hypothetical protein SDRG_10228 [Saprolegnia diclina VS20]